MWENVEIFYGYYEYFKDIWDVLKTFGTFCVHFLHFSGFGIMFKKNLATLAVTHFWVVSLPLIGLWSEADRRKACVSFYNDKRFY
jgi:hypothetical protein